MRTPSAPARPHPADPDPATVAATLGWIEAKATAAAAAADGPAPELGTAEWCALTENDPARWAAVCRAAAAWFRQYVTTGDRIRTELRAELARFEAFAAEREQLEQDAARAARRHLAREACAAIDRREREAKRTDLPNRTGPELIAAAHASWGLTPPASDAGQPASPSAIRRAAA